VPSDISLTAIFDATDVRLWMPKEKEKKTYSISRDNAQLMIITFIFFEILY
jgi:hypothetical protein